MNNTIKITDIKITEFQREALPWTVQEIVESIKDHDYNLAYPIVIDEDNQLVDGGHRIEAAKICELIEVPFVRKPKGVSNIRYSLLCNADRGKGREDDVFDLAELCWKLGDEAPKETGLSRERSIQYRDIKTKLHPLAFYEARFVTKNSISLDDDDTGLVTPLVTKVTNRWRETYFRKMFSHLFLNGDPDSATMRGQLRVIRETIDRFIDDNPKKRVTAKWIGEQAEREAWYIELSRYMRDNLVRQVPLSERKKLIKNIRANVYGDKSSDDNRQKFAETIARMNEQALGIRLYHDDAFQRIPLLPDDISLIVTDPPYNVTDNEWDKIGSDDEYIDWLNKWLEAIRPKLAKDYHLFICISPRYQARVEKLLVDNDWPLKSRIIWSHRNLSKGRDIADKFITMWEMIFHCGTHSLNWPPEWNDERFEVQEFAAPQSNFKEDKKYHPTSKPVGLFELFVKVGSKPGDIVVDTFAGGGVTGAACEKTGQRQCILIERSDEYCEIIEKRLNIKRVAE